LNKSQLPLQAGVLAKSQAVEATELSDLMPDPMEGTDISRFALTELQLVQIISS